MSVYAHAFTCPAEAGKQPLSGTHYRLKTFALVLPSFSVQRIKRGKPKALTMTVGLSKRRGKPNSE